MTALPSYIDPELWSAFVEGRRAMKVPFTQAAEKLVVRKLMRLHADGWDANASLEKSAIYGYRSVFEVSKREVPKAIDPAIAKLNADDKRYSPPTAEQRAKIKQLLGQV